MKRNLLILIFTVLGLGVKAQTQGMKSEIRQSITCIISNVMALSLQDNENGDVSAERVLVINSSIPCNVVVTENSSEPNFAYPPALNDVEATSHGPAISQISGGRKISYFRGDYKFISSLLYTAAQW